MKARFLCSCLFLLLFASAGHADLGMTADAFYDALEGYIKEYDIKDYAGKPLRIESKEKFEKRKKVVEDEISGALDTPYGPYFSYWCDQTGELLQRFRLSPVLIDVEPLPFRERGLATYQTLVEFMIHLFTETPEEREAVSAALARHMRMIREHVYYNEYLWDAVHVRRGTFVFAYRKDQQSRKVPDTADLTFYPPNVWLGK